MGFRISENGNVCIPVIMEKGVLRFFGDILEPIEVPQLKNLSFNWCCSPIINYAIVGWLSNEKYTVVFRVDYSVTVYNTSTRAVIMSFYFEELSKLREFYDFRRWNSNYYMENHTLFDSSAISWLNLTIIELKSDFGREFYDIPVSEDNHVSILSSETISFLFFLERESDRWFKMDKENTSMVSRLVPKKINSNQAAYFFNDAEPIHGSDHSTFATDMSEEWMVR